MKQRHKNQLSDRRPEYISDVIRDYMLAGTFTPDSTSEDFFADLMRRTKKADNEGKTARTNWFEGWLHFEQGLALMHEEPDMAFRHFAKSKRLLSRVSSSGETFIDHVDTQKNLTLMGLLKDGLDPAVNQNRPARHETISKLGGLIVETVKILSHENDIQDRERLFTTLSGIAVAGALLTFGDRSGEPTLIPAPASPRQQQPYSASDIVFLRASTAAVSIQPIDFSLLRYAASGHYSGSQGLRVQRHASDEKCKTGATSGDNLGVSADRELRIEFTRDFRNFGEALACYDKSSQPRLAVARMNLAHALETHAETVERTGANSLPNFHNTGAAGRT